MEKKYKIIDDFTYDGRKMLIVGTNGAVCVMPEEDYSHIINAERKYRQRIGGHGYGRKMY